MYHYSLISITQFDNVFNIVKLIPAHEVAQMFGVDMRRRGNRWAARCPFHEDKKPSFYEYQGRFRCFGCNWRGDAVALVAELQGIKPLEAAKLIASAFNLPVSGKPDPAVLSQLEAARVEAAHEKAEAERVARDLASICRAVYSCLDQITNLTTLERYGWLYHHVDRVEAIANDLIAKDPEIRQAALAEARRWVG